MNVKLAAIAAAFLFTNFFCNSSTNQSAEVSTDKLDEFKKEVNDGIVAPDTSMQFISNDQQPTSTASQANAVPDWTKKIIRTGSINLEVKDYGKYYQLLNEIVRREGGYIAQENQQQSAFKIENSVVVKVPVNRFEESMELIAKGTGGEEIKEKKISSEDVSTQVVDTKSRIEAKKEVRIKYLDLLKQAKNMNEILQVQNEINEIQEQMEMASGRLNYLNQASAYSTINLTFYQVLGAAPESEKEPTFSTKLYSAFQTGWEFIKGLILGVVSIWPMWFLIFGVWVAFRRWKLSKPKSV